MAILFTDLIPSNKDLIEKNTLHHRKEISKEVEEERAAGPAKQESEILQLPLESQLELELAKVRYTQDEIEKTKQERNRRLQMSYQMRSNAWSKKIKSKSYRKARREEKQRKAAEKIQIELLDEERSEGEVEQNTPQNIPEIATAEETAYNFIKNTISAEPISLEQVHTASKATKNNSDKKIDSILEIDGDVFEAEKMKIEESEKPWEKEEVLLGWSTWGGASIEPVKTSSNTKKVKRSGIEIRKRKDFAVSHVIYNEKTPLTRNQKYAINKIPYGYTSIEEYNEVMSIPIDSNHQPVTILNRLIKDEKQKRNHL
ncbi:hypothetical protein NEMIN01_0646 [Nematocida minor]|uniref:uncharacterized protein n=1 Tax=Nematocida minor TaxID=1912983 RepID=UPI00221E5A22|nr:uncharacterized protein NEMIN01_0646 [Nematocida minor]KAI5189693.1 hypothetical protein NEMIN01_0646 [Nematocida minor]